MNSEKMQAALKEVADRMSKWPKWYFNFQLWRHRNGPIARMLRETGAIDIIIEEMKKK